MMAPILMRVLSPNKAGSVELLIVGAVYVHSIELPCMSRSESGSVEL